MSPTVGAMLEVLVIRVTEVSPAFTFTTSGN